MTETGPQASPRTGERQTQAALPALATAGFYDALEARQPAEREAALMASLPGHIAQAQRGTSAFAESLSGVDAASITSRGALAQLPVIRKHELLARQTALRAQDPFGGFSAIGWRGLRAGQGARRVFQSPGPI